MLVSIATSVPAALCRPQFGLRPAGFYRTTGNRNKANGEAHFSYLLARSNIDGSHNTCRCSRSHPGRWSRDFRRIRLSGRSRKYAPAPAAGGEENAHDTGAGRRVGKAPGEVLPGADEADQAHREQRRRQDPADPDHRPLACRSVVRARLRQFDSRNQPWSNSCICWSASSSAR